MDLKHGKKSMGLETCHYFQRAPYPALLQIGSLASNYSQAMLKDISPNLKRVFIFDFAGTLVLDEKQDIFFKQTMSSVSGKAPTPDTMKLLKALSEDPHNAVLVVTGLTQSKLGTVFDDCDHISIASSNGIECSWGTDVMTVEEMERERLEEERQKSNYGSHESVYEDDFQSVSSASSQKEFHEMNAQNLRSIMKRPDDDGGLDAAIGCHGTGSTLGAGANGSGRPLSIRQMELDSTLRDSFIHRPTDPASMRPIISYESYGNVSEINEEESFQFPTTRPRPPWSTVDDAYRAIDWDAVKAIAIPIISKFSARTNGTCLISSIPGIGWSYFNAEPEWGKRQASQLKVELEASLANFDVKVDMLVNGSVEIVPRTLEKVPCRDI